MKENNIIFMGDWIADVYIDCNNISQNQEIINSKSNKGYFNGIDIYPGGTGFVLENFLRLLSNKYKSEIIYMLPDFNYIDYDNKLYAFNLNELFDRSIKFLYKNNTYNNFDIIKIKSTSYLNDIIKPTVKFRYFSKENNEIYFRFDCDNNINVKYINVDNIFNENSNLILIDYDKGYLTEDSIKNLTVDIISNNYKIDRLFINTKPHKLKLYKELFYHLYTHCYTDIIIQMNEKEYTPVENEIHNYFYTNLIVTRGEKNIFLFSKNGTEIIKKEIDISKNIINNVYTTSGCGDIFFSQVMYSYLFIKDNIEDSIKFSIDNMTKGIIYLNNRIFC